MSKRDYNLHEIETSDLSALDLRKEVKNYPDAVAYRIRVWDEDGHPEAELAEALYVPSAGRIGIAYGADADWADCYSAEQGIEMYFHDEESWINSR